MNELELYISIWMNSHKYIERQKQAAEEYIYVKFKNRQTYQLYLNRAGKKTPTTIDKHGARSPGSG